MRWMEEHSYGNTIFIISNFNSLIQQVPEWEKTYYYIGRYYSKILDSNRGKTTLQAQVESAQVSSLLCKNYGKALTFGTRFLFQTMPRLLTVWLDYGESIVGLVDPKLLLPGSGGAGNDERINRFLQMNKLVRRLSEKLPAYQFLTALPQLISRICHKNRQVYDVLEGILVGVLLMYPQQSLWHLMAVAKASLPIRASRVAALLVKVRTHPNAPPGVNMQGLIRQAASLTEHLVNMCNHKAAKGVSTLHVSTDFRPLKRVLPLDIILPLQASMNVSLSSAGNHAVCNPFPAQLPTIFGNEHAGFVRK
jgi:serine/threonine-protein kinase ATR